MNYVELLEMLREHQSLGCRRRTELMSAVRQYAKRFEPAGLSAVIVPAAISATLDKATPAIARLTPSSFANMISRLRVALRLSGAIIQPGRHTSKMAPAWAALFAPVSDHTHRSRISRFFHTATRHGWKPEEITAEHFDEFLRELSDKAVIKHASRLVREAANVWNKLAAENAALPSVAFKLPRKREPYTFTWDHYPDTLGEGIRELLQRLGNPDFLADEQVPALRPQTLKLKEFHLRQFAAALVHRGHDPSELAELKELCSVDNFKEGLRFFYDRAGGRVTHQVAGIGETVYAIAKHSPQTDPVALKEMTKVINGLRRHMKKSGLTEKNHRKLAQFDAPQNRDGILLLPQRLHRIAVTNRASGHFSKQRAAGLMMTAVAVEILLMCPLRVGNLASLDLKTHIRRSHERGHVTTHIYIPAAEVKNKTEIHFELPGPSARMLEEFVEQFRPDLPGAATSTLLFPGKNGRAKRRSTFWEMISVAGRRYLGIEINPHLFRHLGAKLYLDEHPGSYEVMRRVLAHSSLDTTSKFYTGQETGRAIRHYDRSILKLRDEAGAQPRNPRGRHK
jgi:integrase